MNKLLKVLGAVAIAAVIGFSFAACVEEEMEDEASFKINGQLFASTLTFTNNSDYDITVIIEHTYRETKTVPARVGGNNGKTNSVSFYNITPPVTVKYSPASKVRYIDTNSPIWFANK